jgi:hypothetical protein
VDLRVAAIIALKRLRRSQYLFKTKQKGKRVDIPRLFGVHELPVSNGDVVPAFAANGCRFTSSSSGRATRLAVHLACAEPSNIAVAVVWLVLARHHVVRICEFALDDTSFACL